MRRVLLAVAVASCLSAPAAIAAPRDDGPAGVHLEMPRLPAITVALPTVSAPLAQIDAPTDVASADPDFAVVAQGMAKAFSKDGKVSWTIAAPLIVFVLVLISRRYLGGVVPWFGTTSGGYALNIGYGLALAFLNVGLKGGALDAPTIIGVVFQVGYSFLVSYTLHHTQKDAREGIAAKGQLAAAAVTTGDQAGAKLEQLGRGPQA